MRLLKTLTLFSLLATAPCAALAQGASGFDTGMIPSPRILKPAGEVKAAVVLCRMRPDGVRRKTALPPG